VKRLNVISAEIPNYKGNNNKDLLSFLNRYYGGFLKALRNVGAIKGFNYGIDTNNILNVKIKILLNGKALTIKTRNKYIIYETLIETFIKGSY
jgi:hypothetical protein